MRLRPVTAFWLLLLSFALFGVAACDRDTGGAGAPLLSGDTISNSDALGFSGGAWSLGDEVVVLPRVEETFFQRVSAAVRLSPTRVAVADGGRNEILIFDLERDSLAVVGGRGEGPGEFLGLARLRLEADTLVVWEARARRMTRFDEDGTVASTRPGPERVPANLEAWEPGPDAHFGLVTDQGSATPPEGVLRPPRFLVRFAGGAQDTLSSLPGPEMVYVDDGSGLPYPTVTHFGPRAHLAAGGQPWRLVVGDGARPSFEIRDHSGEIVRVVVWREDPPAIPTEALRAHEAARLDAAVRNRQDQASMRRRLDALPIPEHGPHYEGLFVDELGYVWVDRPDLAPFGGNTWTAFSPDGVWLGDLELPDRTDPLRAGEDYVLLRHRDEMDVETVLFMPLARQDR